MNPINQVPTHVESVALPPLPYAPMQPLLTSTLVMEPGNSNILENAQANQITDQFDVHSRPKSSSMTGQLHLTNPPFVQQQIQPTLPPCNANPAIIHPILLLTPPQFVNANHAATCSIPVNKRCPDGSSCTEGQYNYYHPATFF